MKERFDGLARGVLQTIWATVTREPALEHCGLLLANLGSSEVTASLAYPGPLAARNFCLRPEWLLENFLGQRALGLEVAGFYHTHPAGEGLLPSVADRAGHPPGSLVLLVGDGCWRAYRIRYGQWNLLPLRLR